MIHLSALSESALFVFLILLRKKAKAVILVEYIVKVFSCCTLPSQDRDTFIPRRETPGRPVVRYMLIETPWRMLRWSPIIKR